MQSLASRKVTLVLGGARSGKSRYAQHLAAEFDRVVFIATARPSDTEMKEKILQHRHDRPQFWKTVEAPLNLDRALSEEGAVADVLLIDCLTLYVANIMRRRRGGRTQLWDDMQRLCEAVQSAKVPVIIVSNEVGSGIVPAYRIARAYRDALGKLNQQIASIADTVVLMVAGLPLIVKDGTTSAQSAGGNLEIMKALRAPRDAEKSRTG